ncbi:hypothetical protein [Salinisphaera sp.]|uniref:hypothetical protein n=1 Tax=Salinisphaera sp. TaxID=1914330 RepID=UPI002D7A287A|nr:hypothetical protein [Salinisphaera sp.]HET7313212.1 hypothetical protein [Salinisphaera sp.]
MQEPMVLRYICELGGDETIVEATGAEQAADAAVRAYAAEHGAGTYTVTVSEATDYDLPLIAGDDYTVTVG